VENKLSTSRWWLDIRDALDSVTEGRIRHDRLNILLKISPFHLNQISRGAVKALQIFTDRKRKWWVTLAVRISLDEVQESTLPVAILGIDLGIEKAVCSTLLTPEKTRESRYFVQKEKAKSIKKYDRLVADLQREMHTRRNNGLDFDEVSMKLRRMRFKRENVAKEFDRVLVQQLLNHISELSKKHTLFVAIGRLKNIRVRAKRGNYQGRRFRGVIHSWAFARITDSLKHGLAQLGWKVDGKDPRFRAVPEQWTSIICWKCGSKGKRPKQNYFHCSSCGQKINADRNGSINIAARQLTLTKSLHDVRGLGLWTRAVVRGTTNRRARPKAQRRISKKSSRGKSLLSKKGTLSSSGESAAVHHVQTDLSDFGNKIEMSDNGPAVVRTVKNLSVAGSDTPALVQEKEARTVGGTPSR